MSSFSSSLSAHTSAAIPVRCLLMLRRAGSRLASPSCSWRRRNALLLFLRHQSRSTLPLVLPCSTQPSSSLHPPAHTTSTARPLVELSTQKASPLPCASPERPPFTPRPAAMAAELASTMVSLLWLLSLLSLSYFALTSMP